MHVGPCPLRLIAPTFAQLSHLGLSCWSQYPLSQCQMRNGGCQERALHWPRAKMASMNKHTVPRSWSHVSEPQFLFCSQHTPFSCPDVQMQAAGEGGITWRLAELFSPSSPHPTVLLGPTGVPLCQMGLRPHRPPSIQPSAGLLISHPVP